MSTLDLHVNLTHLIFRGRLANCLKESLIKESRYSISSKLSDEIIGANYFHGICVETRLISPQLAQVFCSS